MNIRWNILIVGVVATVFGFLLEAPGPIGSAIWPMPDGMAEPEGTNLALLMVMGGLEALAFGIGAAFLVAAWPWVKANGGGTRLNSVLVYLAVGWLLMNWVPHTALHMAHGNITTSADYGGLVAIEYGFHFTLMLAGVVLAMHAIRSVRVGSGANAGRTTGTTATTPRKAA